MYGEGTKFKADAALRQKIIDFISALQHSGVELSFTMSGMVLKELTDDPTVINLPSQYQNLIPSDRWPQ
jgi:hypothetical protein